MSSIKIIMALNAIRYPLFVPFLFDNLIIQREDQFF